MILYFTLILLFTNCVRTRGDFANHGLMIGKLSDFSLWPSVLNSATMMRLRKREVQNSEANVPGHIEGEDITRKKLVVDLPTHQPDAEQPEKKTTDQKPTVSDGKTEVVKENSTSTTVVPPVSIANSNSTSNPGPLDINSPGVVKRGLIVFSGFALLAVAYFIFYRGKTKNDANNLTNNDANQFRYGVLESDERKDNLELSRMPLTMESDDDDDEDLEIFDLEQKRQSMSYVNLQNNDQDVVFSGTSRQNNDNVNILLDIDENDTDQLINWSSHGNNNKSIL